MSLRIEETPGHPIPETYIHRETGEQQRAALVTADNLAAVAAWCGGRVAGRSVMVPGETGLSWTAAPGFYVLEGQPRYPVWAAADFVPAYVLKSIVDADWYARKEVLG